MVVIMLARQMGVLTNKMTRAQAMIINGITLKTTLYSFKVLSTRAVSDSTKAEASLL